MFVFVYDIVSQRGMDKVILPDVASEVRGCLKSIIQDPLVKILRESSSLTEIQLETVLIDVLAEEMAQSKLSYEQKSRMRISKEEVTKGSFNRTLRQARRNIRRSIATVFLLGYLGFFERPSLEPFILISNRLEQYKNLYRKAWTHLQKGQVDEETQKALTSLRSTLLESLEVLTTLKRVGDM